VKVLAVAVAGLAGAVAIGGRPSLVRTRLAASAGPHGVRADLRRRRGPRGVSARVQAAAAVTAGVLAGLVVSGPGLAVLAGLAAGLFVATRFRTSSTRRHHSTEAAVSEACLLLAAELRSGAHPRHAVSVVGAEWPDLFGAVARRADVDGEVSAALREAASGPGRSALATVAAAWEVSERTGAALSDVLTAVADSLRADSAARREAEAQLSSVRVTARLLAVLPVGTLLLLSGDGAALRFLLGTPPGLACLGGTTVLMATGLWWIDRLVRPATTSFVVVGRTPAPLGR
jgi:tight adherence protein B